MPENSETLIKDFYTAQLKRMHWLMIFLVVILLLTFGCLAWLKLDQNKSNKKLSDTFNTLQTYVQGESARNTERDTELQGQHTKLFKAISCLLILHDSHAITDPKVSTKECQKTAEEINNMLPQSTAPQSNNSVGTNISPDKSKPAPGTSSNPTPPQQHPEPPKQNIIQRGVGAIMNVLQKVTNLL